MNKVIVVKDNQSILDIAIEHCGDVDRAMDIVAGNNNIATMNDPSGYEIELSLALVPGLKLIINEDWVNKKMIREVGIGLATSI